MNESLPSYVFVFDHVREREKSFAYTYMYTEVGKSLSPAFVTVEFFQDQQRWCGVFELKNGPARDTKAEE